MRGQEVLRAVYGEFGRTVNVTDLAVRVIAAERCQLLSEETLTTEQQLPRRRVAVRQEFQERKVAGRALGEGDWGLSECIVNPLRALHGSKEHGATRRESRVQSGDREIEGDW